MSKPAHDALRADLDTTDPDAQDAWAVEIQRRLTRIDAGEVVGISMGDAIARMHRVAREGRDTAWQVELDRRAAALDASSTPAAEWADARARVLSGREPH